MDYERDKQFSEFDLCAEICEPILQKAYLEAMSSDRSQEVTALTLNVIFASEAVAMGVAAMIAVMGEKPMEISVAKIVDRQIRAFRREMKEEANHGGNG